MINVTQAHIYKILILVTLAYFSSTHARTVENLLGKPCRGSYQCEINQWCYHHQCDLPCAKLDCAYHTPPDGICVVREHQPICKYPADLEEENAIRANGGCVTSIDCAEEEMCLYETCLDACQQLNCTAEQDDGECEVINHHPICITKGVPEEDKPFSLVGLGGDCTESYDCESELNCKDGMCYDPCANQWCRTFDDPFPPEDYSTERKALWHVLKAYDWKCVVFHHIAECVIKAAAYPHGHREVDI